MKRRAKCMKKTELKLSIKFLSKMERNFLVCSDCAYFKETEIIDDRYPMIKKGKCVKHEKIVDNRWETKCEDNTYYCQCNMCNYFVDNSDSYLADDDWNSPFRCGFRYISINEEDRVCEFFEDSSK